MPAKKISLESAKSNKLFYFVANAVVFRSTDSRCLVLRRSMRERVHPGKYCVPGGKLEWSGLDISHPTRLNGDVLDFESAIEKTLAKELMEEANISIEPQLYYLNNVAFVRPDGIPVVLIKFAAKYRGGEVAIEPGSFDDFRWVNTAEALQLDCILGVPDEIRQTIEIFSK